MRRGNEIKHLDEKLSVLSQPFAGRELLTPRERVVLAQIVRGAPAERRLADSILAPERLIFIGPTLCTSSARRMPQT
jgi:hypothetical protein